MSGGWTPGRWRVEAEAEPEASDVPEVYVCHAGTVCDQTVVATMGSWGDVRLVETERLANARLIAAAPDLYEALQTLVEGPQGALVYAETWAPAIAALARARGEAA